MSTALLSVLLACNTHTFSDGNQTVCPTLKKLILASYYAPKQRERVVNVVNGVCLRIAYVIVVIRQWVISPTPTTK
jgi:hypothetical protein